MEVEQARDIIQLASSLQKLGNKLSVGEPHISMTDEEVVGTAEELIQTNRELNRLVELHIEAEDLQEHLLGEQHIDDDLSIPERTESPSEY